jgi:hypothetical protein
VQKIQGLPNLGSLPRRIQRSDQPSCQRGIAILEANQTARKTLWLYYEFVI